jgi:hypothetical protein
MRQSEGGVILEPRIITPYRLRHSQDMSSMTATKYRFLVCGFGRDLLFFRESGLSDHTTWILSGPAEFHSPSHTKPVSTKTSDMSGSDCMPVIRRLVPARHWRFLSRTYMDIGCFILQRLEDRAMPAEVWPPGRRAVHRTSSAAQALHVVLTQPLSVSFPVNRYLL